MASRHPALQPGKIAVITGGANGIGLATARRLAALGLRICLADRDEEALASAVATIDGALGVPTDVSDRTAIEALAATVADRLGPPSVLMNNAGTGGGGDALSDPAGWERVIGINLMSMVYGIHAFVPAMIAAGEPALVINTGSKQGITTPPGDTSYNVSKAGIKVLTESLAHTLRTTPDCKVTAHLLIPGFTYTGMMRSRMPTMPPSAWTSEQVADRLLEGLAAGEFYILCEDNDTPRALDEKRMLWAAQDVTENRPALSRWHPDWKDRFEAFVRGE